MKFYTSRAGARLQRATLIGAAGILLAPGTAATAHADPSLAEIAAEIQALKAENRQIKAENQKMKAAIANIGGQTRRTGEKVRAVSARTEEIARRPVAAAGSAAYPALPEGAVPAFVTANRQLQFGALTITPGGFFAADSVFRSRTVQGDISTPWNSIPFGPQAGTNEFRFTSRATRIAGLVEAAVTPTFLLSGYGEFDFQGSGVTSNENNSNSFVPRIRNLYAAMDLNDYGVHVLAGQSWSLATLNSKGITPRNEVTPPSIDAGYIPGFVYKRQPQIRLTKDFGGKLWLSLSAEEPQTTYSNCTFGVNGTSIPAGATGNAANQVTCQLPGTGILNGTGTTVTTLTGAGTGATATSTTSLTNFSLNHIPDVIGKAAYEARLGERDIHFEGFGMYRDLYDRVAYATPLAAYTPQATNHDSTGYGVGGGVIVPVLPRKLDFQASGMYGRGIGSYGTSQLPDSTFNALGAPAPIPETMLLGGVTAHVTPSIDVYGFAGEEVVQPKYFATNVAGTTATVSGYGSPLANNTGCYNTITTANGVAPGSSTSATGSCNGQTKRIWQLSGGMWDKLYRGSFGEVRVGVQYSYTQRELFSGNGTTTIGGVTYGPARYSPKQNENVVLTSLRYYPFQ